MEKLILKCNDLHKKIRKKQILKGISLEVQRGEIVGFIGPNGAGKTTTIKLILGLQKITKGSVIINGYDIKKDFVNAIKNVGTIVENPDLYMYMSGYNNLKLSQNYYDKITDDRISEVVKLVGLEKRIYDKVSKYSLGMRQRLGIAQAILHKPNLLILDEPTNGLDPEGIIDIRNLLKKLAYEEKIGILVSSHNLSELENMCDKVCIIKNGIIVEETDIEKLKNETMKECYIFEVDDSSKLKNIIKNQYIILDNKHIKIYINKEELPIITKELEKNELIIYTITKKEIKLEDVFLKKIGGNNID
ncbi:MAG: ABC transporter ATP-binding protein [Clostridia bacterium]|nr:ABC transporter ATP-binding protein [Clostridia bacterium]